MFHTEPLLGQGKKISDGLGHLTKTAAMPNFYCLIWRLKSEPSLIIMLKSLFLFSDLAVKATKSENKKGFSRSEKAWMSSRVSFIDTAAGGIATSIKETDACFKFLLSY